MHIAKRGMPQLPYVFYRAALFSIEYNSDLLGCLLSTKVRRGKPNKKALIAVAQKLIHIVYALLKSQNAYVRPQANLGSKAG